MTGQSQASMQQKAEGLLLLNKKSGFTSFDSLGIVKKTFATGKAGHTGTLDKFAAGLLLVLVGRAVKLNFLFENCSKEYFGTILFGRETDTLDPEGAVVAEGPVPSRQEVEAALDAFRGEILQSPPAYSALHINGRRAHELAREGKAPEMKKRPATIYELELVSWTPPEAVIRTKVSAGTYIRSLARDIAISAGSRAHLSALKRSSVGPFRAEDAVSDEEGLADALRPLEPKLFGELSVPCFFLDEKPAEDFKHGRPVEKFMGEALHELPSTNGSCAAVFFKGSSQAGSAQTRLLGVLLHKNGKWSYGHVFADN